MTETKPDYVVVSFSGGKDSTAMLLHMIELKEPINEVIYCDTSLDFPDMYTHIEKVKEEVIKEGIKFTTLKAVHDFEYYLLEIPVNSPKYGKTFGYGWPQMGCRWCTKFLKTDLVDKYLKELKQKYNLIQCVGFASDEIKRTERGNNKGQRWPLIEWGWNEAQALKYCTDRGYTWNGLYEHFSRVSCWCCPLQKKEELWTLWKFYPDLWRILTDWQHQLNDNPKSGKTRYFQNQKTVDDFGKMFLSRSLANKSQTFLDSFIEIEETPAEIGSCSNKKIHDKREGGELSHTIVKKGGELPGGVFLD